MTTDRTFVIVGASLTGAKAAETPRAEGFYADHDSAGKRGFAALIARPKAASWRPKPSEAVR
jgi:hypothetical protein